ncbi:Sec-independent protein translocase subunit TatA [Nocardioides zeae]|uniref:Sec-independent protein translocase protein TatA n=1 Tax=Nocardioides imazamoxiresistens TaxID=3231893 RepID=A0ABU3PSW9_9ACTN|nr:Sec-independent protein translocase subunit TatA [Nocardioides zeae]MDT9592325.1 Sec-independent protein translocase subunit TatA [Nocardioides zeae]
MPGGWELVLIVLVIVLLFGARKLPELARGTGQALRIFKSETKGLTDDDDDRAKDQQDRPAQGTGALGAREADLGDQAGRPRAADPVRDEQRRDTQA